MPNVEGPDALGDWVVEKRRSQYSVGYRVGFVLGMLGQTVPPPPRIAYTVRNSSSGETRTVNLPGDHSPSDLVQAVVRPQSDLLRPNRAFEHGQGST
jgi:hypothetical protein